MARGLTTAPTPACRDSSATPMLRPMARKPRHSTRPSDRRAIGNQPAARAFWDERWPLVLAAIFVLTLAWRLFALARLAGSPFMGDLDADSAAYWAWSGEIRGGAWVGRQAFFLGALYPYVLAVLRELTTDSLRAVLSVQCMFGALAVTLLTDASRRLTSAPVGLVVGALLGMLTMGAFFDLLVLMESVLFLLSALVLCCIVAWNWQHRPGLGAMVVGACLGLAAQGRATHVLVLIPFVWFLFATLERPRAMRAALAALAMVIALALPTVIRHRLLVHEWIPYTYSLGFNAYVGNGPEANGSYVLITGSVEDESSAPGNNEGGTKGDGRAYLRQIEGLDLSPGQSSKLWLQRTLTFVRREPGLTARRFLEKLGLLVNHREVPQVENVAVMERVLGPLGPPGLGSFVPLGVLGMIGMVLALRRTPRERFALAMLATLALATAAFFVTDRYRHQLVPALALLAAITLQTVWDGLRSGKRGLLMRIAFGAVVAGALTALPRVPFDPEHLAWEADASLGIAHLKRGEDAQALIALRRAVTLDRSGRLQRGEGSSAQVVRASVYEDLAVAERRTGDWPAALGTYREAARLAPDARSLQLEYGKTAAAMQHLEEARRAFSAAGVSEAQAAEALFADASQAQAREDGAGLEAALRGILLIVPGDERAQVALIRTLIQAARFDEATADLEHAHQAGLDAGVYAAHEVLLAATRGDTASEATWRARITPSSARDPRVVATLAMVPVVSRATP